MTLLLSALALQSAAFSTMDGKSHPFVEPRPTVFLFVMTECPIVRGYVPEVRRLSRTKGVRFFIVHSDPTTTKASARAFHEEYGLRIPAVLDADHVLARRFQISAVPTAVVLDGKGRQAYAGRIDDRYPSLGVQRKPRQHDLRDAIAAVLAGKTIARRNLAIGCAIPDL